MTHTRFSSCSFPSFDHVALPADIPYRSHLRGGQWCLWPWPFMGERHRLGGRWGDGGMVGRWWDWCLNFRCPNLAKIGDGLNQHLITSHLRPELLMVGQNTEEARELLADWSCSCFGKRYLAAKFHLPPSTGRQSWICSSKRQATSKIHIG